MLSAISQKLTAMQRGYFLRVEISINVIIPSNLFFILLMFVKCFFPWVGFKKVDRNVYIHKAREHADVSNDYGGGKQRN